MRAQSDLPVIVGLLCSVVSRQREPLRQPKPAKHTGWSGQCMMRQSGSVSRQKACRPGADATCCVKFYVLYPCWERSVHTLLVTGARLCFCTRDGATTGAVRPVVLGHTLTHGRRIHTRCLAYRGKGTSLKPGEGSEGVGCCPSCTCIGGRSSLRPCYSTRSDQVPGPITSSMVQGSSVPAVGKLLGDPVTVYPLLPAHDKPRIHGQQVGRAASAGRE